jgi:hypothetical protein
VRSFIWAVRCRTARATYPETLTTFADARTSSPIAFPYLVLHHEEFAWPRNVTTHAGELLPHRFTHHRPREAGLFSVALVVTRPKARARTLSGSLPYGVRTFLPAQRQGDHPVCSDQRLGKL